MVDDQTAQEFARSWPAAWSQAAAGLVASTLLILILFRILRRGLAGTEPPPRPVAVICPLTLLLYLGLTLGAQVAYGLIRGTDAPAAEGNMRLGITVTIGVNCLVVLLVLGHAWSRFRAPPRLFGLANPRPAGLAFGGLTLLAALPAFIGVQVLSFHLNEALGLEQHQALVQSLLEDPTLRESPLVLAAIVLVVPLLEEVIFRGLVQRSFRAVLNPAWAITAAALVFALSHDLQSSLPVFVVGVTLGIICEVTGSVYPAMLGHSVFNGFMIAYIHLEAAG